MAKTLFFTLLFIGLVYGKDDDAKDVFVAIGEVEEFFKDYDFNG